ncbi:MAG: YCF48-related protein, partial [Myxococcales bacterium]
MVSKLVVTPPRAGLNADVEITFRADEPLSKAEAVVAGNSVPCVLGAEGHVTCGYRTSGTEIEGVQTVLVRATDTAGNATEAQTDLRLDFTAPRVTFTRQPPAVSRQRSAVFEFQSDESARFACALDGAPALPCLSPASYDDLADGEHRFSLSARDDVGNAETLEAVFLVDATAPETQLDAAPLALSNQQPAIFQFSSDDPTATFECSADSAPFSACSSPLELNLREGTHTFAVRAVDPAGNADPTPASASFMIDLTAPRTTIAPVPDTGAPSRTISFFSADDPSASFECALDGGLYAPCSSPLPLTGLSDGERVFSVRASDPAGNVENPPASVTFVVDTTPPVPAISFGPPATSTQASADFQFAANEPASFECALDGAAFAPCSSPQRVEVTADGAHTFEVHAIDRYGNRSLEPARYGWTMDAFPPVVLFTAAPPEHTDQRSALLTYVANKPGCSFRCSLDGAPAAPCSGSSSYSNLADGPHVFGVVAIDTQGRAGDQAEARWTVDTVAPTASIVAGPPAVSNETPVRFELSANEPASFECSLDGATFAPCVSPVEIPVGEGSHVFSVRAVDLAGNSGPIATHLFETDLTPPPVPAVDQPDPSVVANSTPTLTWSASSSAVAYLFELSTTDDFSQVTQQAERTALYYVPSPLASARYYFRVRARDLAGNLSAWSATRVIEVRSWRFLNPRPQGATLLDVACADAQRCWFIGEAGVALRTLDGGTSFLQASTGATGFLSSVAMLDEASGVAVGASGVIVRTHDGGVSWWRVESGTGADLFTVRFAGQIGFAAGASGVVLKSLDGGQSWSRVTTNVTWAVRDLAVLDAAEQIVVGVGTGGRVLRTEDGGASWAVIESGASSLLRAVSFVDGSVGYAAGDGGTVRKTTDGGRTWGSAETGTSRTFYGVTFIDAQTGYTVGDSTTAHASLRKTSDGGASWANHIAPPGPSL